MRPPEDLKGRGRRFWRDVLDDHELRVDEVELLVEVCRMLDLADLLRESVSGVTAVGSKGQTTVAPQLVELRQVRAEIRHALRALSIPDPAQELPDGVTPMRRGASA